MVLHLILFLTNLFFSNNHLQIIKTSLQKNKPKNFFVLIFLTWWMKILIDNWLSCNSISEAYENLNVDPNRCYRPVGSIGKVRLFRLCSNTRQTRTGSAHQLIVSFLVLFFFFTNTRKTHHMWQLIFRL